MKILIRLLIRVNRNNLGMNKFKKNKKKSYQKKHKMLLQLFLIIKKRIVILFMFKLVLEVL